MSQSIAVLAGGDSHERAVSLASGAEAAAALRKTGARVEVFDPAGCHLEDIAWNRFDACFIALHGGAGEDGRVQHQLETLHVPYTGSDPLASRLAMSKAASKQRFLQAGVPTLPFAVHRADAPLEELASRVAELGYPVVVKPDAQGSSLGVGRAEAHGDLAACVADSARYDRVVLAERWVSGREFTVAVLGRTPLPLLEIVPQREIFDYQAKYRDATACYRFDTGLPAAVAHGLQMAAVAAAEALGTSGLVRVDLMLEGSGRPWVLEVNTVPGLTRTSLAPKAAARAGLGLPGLCSWMLRDALGCRAAAA